MTQFDVYPRYPVTLERAEGCYVYDARGTKYLDMYGGHAVISIGHTHPSYVVRITRQLQKIGFYSNSVNLPIQEELAEKLGRISGYPDYSLFLCNSGAEANENAMKLASFHTGRKKIIVFENAFHGRTSLAVAATHNAKIQAPVNSTNEIIRLPWNDVKMIEQSLNSEIAAILIEGIQGVGGVHVPDDTFLQKITSLAHANGSLVILDEIQSGYGRTGKFFAHQFAEIKPDIISIAKGMGNGFPIGGILIAPQIQPWSGMLGTTFGGNPLACAAALAVLEVIELENLLDNAKKMGDILMHALARFPGISSIRGRGLMIGMDLSGDVKRIKTELLNSHHIFTGTASSPETIRLLPPLTITHQEVTQFLTALKSLLINETVSVN